MLKKIVYILLFSIALNAKFIGDAGYGYNFYRYEEPELMKIEGALHTIFAKLAYLGDYVGLEFNYLQAIDQSTQYYGSTMSGIPLLNIPSKDNFHNIDFKFGKRLNIFDNYDGLGYVGIGYRYLDNKISGSGGYKREQVYYYIPIGFYASDEMFADGLFARYGAEVRYLFLGVNKTHIGDAIANVNPSVLKMIQKNNFGFRVHSGFEYFLSDEFKIFMQISADYWYVRETSTAVTTYMANGLSSQLTLVEPSNNTVQFGIELGVGF